MDCLSLRLQGSLNAASIIITPLSKALAGLTCNTDVFSNVDQLGEMHMLLFFTAYDVCLSLAKNPVNKQMCCRRFKRVF